MSDTISGYKSIIAASFAALIVAFLLQPRAPNFADLEGKNVLLCGGSTGIGALHRASTPLLHIHS